MIKGFHHVAVTASDFKKSCDFYIGCLGLKETNRWGEGNSEIVMLELGDGSKIELFAGGSGEPESNPKIKHISLCTDDVDGYAKKAEAFGMNIISAPADVDIKGKPGFKARVAFCNGPDGEVIEFFKPMD